MDFFVFLIGLSVGSFLNVLILRIPRGGSLRGRSQCFTCERKLEWFELIPVLSFITLRGKCRTCSTGISLQYPIVELATALLFLLVFFMYRPAWGLVVGYALLLSLLLVLFVQDFRFGVLPDSITLPAIVIAFLIHLLFSPSILPFLGASILGALFFYLQWFVSRGEWIGGGDIRLGALLGMILGWPLIVVALGLAYVSGAIVGVALLLTHMKQWKSTIPFGTFLTTATVVTLFWGEGIVTWYLRTLGL